MTTLLGESEERRAQAALLLSKIGYSDHIVVEASARREPIEGRMKRLKAVNHQIEPSFDSDAYLSALDRWVGFMQSTEGKSYPAVSVLGRARLQRYPDGIDGFVRDIITFGDAPRSLSYFPISALWFERGDKWIPLEGFSSGERALFFRFLGLIREVTDGSLVLIDEPEIHLHPEWVQRFVGLLVSLFRNVKAHILIASHSPLIAADVPADCILGLKKEGDQVLPYTVEDRSLGTSPSVILREVFGVKDELGDFTRQIIERVRKHIQKGNYEQALALYDLLGDSDEKFQLFRELRELRERGN